jgi:hypothetical protein
MRIACKPIEVRTGITNKRLESCHYTNLLGVPVFIYALFDECQWLGGMIRKYGIVTNVV